MHGHKTILAYLAVASSLAAIFLSSPVAGQEDPGSQEMDVTGVSWFSIANGGMSSEADDFRLVGTIGQMTAGAVGGDEFSVESGFAADVQEPEAIVDGFNLREATRWMISNLGACKGAVDDYVWLFHK